MSTALAPSWDLPNAALGRRRKPASRRADEDDGQASRRPSRARAGRFQDDGSHDDDLAGRRLLKSLDAALALPNAARVRALATIARRIGSGPDADRASDVDTVLPDLALLASHLVPQGIDDETRESVGDLARALRALAVCAGLDMRRAFDLETRAERLASLAAAA